MWIDETDPSSNREPLVQVDARRANVALARPIRMPNVRAAASSVLGTTCAGGAARPGITAWNAGQKRLDDRNRLEGSMFVQVTLAFFVLLSLILSLVRCPGIATRKH